MSNPHAAQPSHFPDDDRWPLNLFRRVPFSQDRAVRSRLHNLDFLESALHDKGYTRLNDHPDWPHHRHWQHRSQPDRRVYIELGCHWGKEWRDDMFLAHSVGRAAWWVRLLPQEVLK